MPSSTPPRTRYRLLYPDARRPRRMTNGAASYDAFVYLQGRTDIRVYSGDDQLTLRSAYPTTVVRDGEPVATWAFDIHPHERAVLPLGYAMALPSGWEASPRPRGSVPSRRGLLVANAPGTIDEDYRGEVFLSMLNSNPSTIITVHHLDALAQIRFQPTYEMDGDDVDTLDETERGDGALGSTGATGR